MRVIAIIQARMGSSRLPGKILMPLDGKPVIERVVERTRLIPALSDLVIATTNLSQDDPLVRFCESKQIPVFCGSESDVLERYYQAAVFYNADIIVRITGDCPLIDPVESQKVIEELVKNDLDFVSNTNPPKLPDGLDTEVLTMQALKKNRERASKALEREHVTLYMYSNPGDFKIGAIDYQEDRSLYRLTLDEMDDYHLLSKVFDLLKQNHQFGYLDEVISLMKSYPDLLEINQGIQRNEGLRQSLERDCRV